MLALRQSVQYACETYRTRFHRLGLLENDNHWVGSCRSCIGRNCRTSERSICNNINNVYNKDLEYKQIMGEIRKKKKYKLCMRCDKFIPN
ncbi:hypothetical protein CEXT_646461 [Caerostris extrusa]|uniref:Uncharacterized protein n=1 Tax=Caerostris extrusa TaxID=172846 RepID=A0AAV4M9A4_CAEEX|nr:hypothetical protein CEXT_646461 [Caerostris extrusa]